ncbi:MAG: N-methyl-L-tryptophan oxidase [Chloroflexi bacterium]|nr:N-methyl-L-tryptophan oxidase [Chloroflexota bacterium]MCY4248504.1 N-methyl-L-tryptophan oxidase [Chloroflexota bacterium]
MTDTYDAIVIGAGAMGSAAAYYLSRRGQRVLLLEQFALDHQRGSSYGFSRIIRYSYDKPDYVDLAKDTYPLWFALEDELGEQLVMKTGGIDFGPKDDPTLQATIAAARESRLAHELLAPAEAQEQFPQFRFADNFAALYQPDSGFVRASRAVRGHVQLARANGAELLDHAAVTAIRIGSDSVEVASSRGDFSAGRLVVTAGAWAKSLLAQTGIDLPLRVLRCQLNFLAPADLPLHSAENCPVYIAHFRARDGEGIYGIPAHAGSGFKVAFHGGAAVAHPSEIDYATRVADVENLRPFLRAHIPGVAAAPVQSSRVCLYTQTPDEHFIIDKHPNHAHVVIGAGFSGHGFKFSTTIGKMLSELALDGRTPHTDSLFKLTRFIA